MGGPPWALGLAVRALLLTAACLGVLQMCVWRSEGQEVAMLQANDARQIRGSKRMELLGRLRGELASRISKQRQIGDKVKAFVAASHIPKPMKVAVEDEAGGDESTQAFVHRTHKAFKRSLAVDRNWKALRADWKPYDPSKSLQQNMQEHEAHAPPVTEARHRGTPTGFAKYESDMRHQQVRGGHSACADWGQHPIDCLREAYHNKLAGTKFASLQRKYDGHVSEEDLSRERKLLTKKVAQGLVTGQVKAPKHGAVRRWVDAERRDLRDRQKEAMDEAVAHESEREKERIYLRAVAKDWGTGVAKDGPNAGRRFYIDYVHRITSWNAPKYVEKALKKIRTTEREKELARATHEAQLYKEGFRAAQKAFESAPKPTAYPTKATALPLAPAPAPPKFEDAQNLDDTHTGINADERVRSVEEAHAQVAISRFLRHAKGGALAAPQITRDALAQERRKIAGELGVQSLTHTEEAGGGRGGEQGQAVKAIDRFLQSKGVHPSENAYTTQDLKHLREKIAHELGVRSLVHPSEGAYIPKGAPQEATGIPLGIAPTDDSPPVMTLTAPMSEGGAVEAPVGGGGSDKAVTSGVVSAYKEGLRGEQEREGALGSEVGAQAQMIKDLESKVESLGHSVATAVGAPERQVSAAATGGGGGDVRVSENQFLSAARRDGFHVDAQGAAQATGEGGGAGGVEGQGSKVLRHIAGSAGVRRADGGADERIKTLESSFPQADKWMHRLRSQKEADKWVHRLRSRKEAQQLKLLNDEAARRVRSLEHARRVRDAGRGDRGRDDDNGGDGRASERGVGIADEGDLASMGEKIYKREIRDLVRFGGGLLHGGPAQQI